MNNQRGLKTIFCLAILVTVLITSQAIAVPTLQLYMPGSTYNATTETWLTFDNPFELQVLGADQPNNVDKIENVKLHIAIPDYDGYDESSGTITIKDESNATIASLSGGNAIYGIPPELGGSSGNSRTHGVFPTLYFSVGLPNLLVSTAGETILNYNPGETGSDTGDIQTYFIEYSNLFLLHMDLTGTAVYVPGRNGYIRTEEKFAPFSHDADAKVPEPSTLLLLVSGLAGLGLIGRRKGRNYPLRDR